MKWKKEEKEINEFKKTDDAKTTANGKKKKIVEEKYQFYSESAETWASNIDRLFKNTMPSIKTLIFNMTNDLWSIQQNR